MSGRDAMKWRRRWTDGFALAVVLCLSGLAGCGEPVATGTGDSKICAGSGEVGESDTQTSAQALSCNKQRKAAYNSGRRVDDITVVSVEGELVEIDTATQYKKMKEAAARDGVRLAITSGFRTMGEQRYLYRCYVNQSCNNGNLAAKPGYSNHQNGLALDLNTSTPGVYPWLHRNANRFGFERTVSSEIWHWEYLGSRPVSDRICGGSGGSAGSSKRYDMKMSIRFHGAMIDRDLSVSAADVPTVFNNASGKGKLRAEMRMTNRSNVALQDVRIGYWFETPYLTPVSYAIHTDAPQHDKRHWQRSSADGDVHNPGRSRMGKAGYLRMHKFAPGETKRVLVDFETGPASIARVDHPDVRFHVRNIHDAYGNQNGYGNNPSHTNKFGENLRTYAQVDVVDRDAWHFAGDHVRETLHWRGAGHIDELKLNTDDDLLAVKTEGPDPKLLSPTWTKLQPWRWDELVLKVRSHNGPHEMEVYWAHNREKWDGYKSMRVEVPGGDGRYHYVVIPIGAHPTWERGKDVIRRLRIDPHIGSDSPGWYGVDSMFLQTSSNRATSSEIASYVDGHQAKVVSEFDGEFADDDGNPHEDNIDRLARAGIVKGCVASGHFPAYCPDDHFSRAAVAAMLVRAFNLSGATRDHFDDDDGHVLEAEINAVARAGLTLGCTSDRFCPNRPVTLGQAALFLVRGVDHVTGGTEARGMTLEDAVDKLKAWGAINRSSCDRPADCAGDTLDRAQAASLFARVLRTHGLL